MLCTPSTTVLEFAVAVQGTIGDDPVVRTTLAVSLPLAGTNR
jgi:hypothetical protein